MEKRREIRTGTVRQGDVRSDVKGGVGGMRVKKMEDLQR